LKKKSGRPEKKSELGGGSGYGFFREKEDVLRGRKEQSKRKEQRDEGEKKGETVRMTRYGGNFKIRGENQQAQPELSSISDRGQRDPLVIRSGIL